MFTDCLNYQAFAFIRPPNQNKIGYISSQNPVFNPKFDGISDNGFVFAPFDKTEHPVNFIPGNPNFMSYEAFDKINFALPLSDLGLENKAEIKETNKDDFCDWINRFKAMKNTTDVQKIIFSAVHFLKIPDWFDILKYFRLLTHCYPNAYICLFYIKHSGLWISASPELLAEKNGTNLKSVALAATKKQEDSSKWNKKDYNEFNFVKSYIHSVFEKYKLTDTRQNDPPETIVSGPVKHLIKHFQAGLPSLFPFQSFISDLHPTPAVCGFPGEDARKMIYDYEPHNREYYAGYFGMLSPRFSQLYVNIRCAKFLPGFLKVIAGVGITEESDPENEWQEILDKLSVLQSRVSLD